MPALDVPRASRTADWSNLSENLAEIVRRGTDHGVYNGKELKVTVHMKRWTSPDEREDLTNRGLEVPMTDTMLDSAPGRVPGTLKPGARIAEISQMSYIREIVAR
jgi:hypothetical protein